jgi:hypothetical protein
MPNPIEIASLRAAPPIAMSQKQMRTSTIYFKKHVAMLNKTCNKGFANRGE